ncbi:MAG TPA: sirohydrochlorin cobaltochelatase [Thermodesulfobacteriota bacterium]|nr:sirohydrochlorin cobaltochelatase [Thermodesulfobacteriota bacterium]
MIFIATKLTLAMVSVCSIFLVTAAAAAPKPAIVLVAFGTSTKAFETYKYFEEKIKQRFPDHEIRWAYTSKIVREKLKEEEQRELPDLAQALTDLKAAGVTQVAVQSLHVVPGEEWEKKVKICQETPGLKIALGKPLLSSLEDRRRVLDTLAKDFPSDLKDHAVLLVGHGSPSPAGTREYLSLYTLMLSKFKSKNVFLGTIEGQPQIKTALGALKKSSASKVTIVPLLFVAGDHFLNDIMGDQEGSIKSELLAAKPYEIQAVDKGLGYNDGIIQIYQDHLTAALDSFVEKKKEKKPKKGKK